MVNEDRLNFYIDNEKRLVYILQSAWANIAQLVELLICNQWVRGSSPCVGTIKKPPQAGGFLMVII